MQAKLGTGQVQGKQTLVCTGHPHLMARTQGGHQHTGIGRHHTPPLPAGYKGIRSREQARIEPVQGIPIEVAAGFGKGAVRDTAHVSGITKTKTKPRTITAKLPKKLSSMTCWKDPRWLIKAPMRWGKGSLRLRVKAWGVEPAVRLGRRCRCGCARLDR